MAKKKPGEELPLDDEPEKLVGFNEAEDADSSLELPPEPEVEADEDEDDSDLEDDSKLETAEELGDQLEGIFHPPVETLFDEDIEEAILELKDKEVVCTGTLTFGTKSTPCEARYKLGSGACPNCGNREDEGKRLNDLKKEQKDRATGVDNKKPKPRPATTGGAESPPARTSKADGGIDLEQPIPGVDLNRPIDAELGELVDEEIDLKPGAVEDEDDGTGDATDSTDPETLKQKKGREWAKKRWEKGKREWEEKKKKKKGVLGWLGGFFESETEEKYQDEMYGGTYEEYEERSRAAGSYETGSDDMEKAEEDEAREAERDDEEAKEKKRRDEDLEDEDKEGDRDDGPGTYDYEAMDTTGDEVTGTVDASSRDDAEKQVRAKGYFVTRLTKRPTKAETEKEKRKRRERRKRAKDFGMDWDADPELDAEIAREEKEAKEKAERTTWAGDAARWVGDSFRPKTAWERSKSGAHFGLFLGYWLFILTTHIAEEGGSFNSKSFIKTIDEAYNTRLDKALNDEK